MLDKKKRQTPPVHYYLGSNDEIFEQLTTTPAGHFAFRGVCLSTTFSSISPIREVA
jgi:hypothetical protein